jgi:uncharacterized membrane protein YhdT
MSASETSWAVWLVILVQVAGLLSVWLARASEGLTLEKRFRWLFLACLSLVAGSTVIGLSLGVGFWLTSGATLSTMAVTGIFDSGKPRDAVVW